MAHAVAVETPTYSMDDKIGAAIQYAIKGRMSLVSLDTGIPESTLSVWKNKSDWWDAVIEEHRSQNNDRFVAKCDEIIGLATATTLEKLPDASAKDAATIGAIYYDKLRLALSLPTTITSNSKGLDDLAKEFKALADKFQSTVVSDQ